MKNETNKFEKIEKMKQNIFECGLGCAPVVRPGVGRAPERFFDRFY